ncbi:MAG: hypothetical protein LEGION0398_MBIBDBAK_00160 [Legionellaceae bacterium]
MPILLFGCSECCKSMINFVKSKVFSDENPYNNRGMSGFEENAWSDEADNELPFDEDFIDDDISNLKYIDLYGKSLHNYIITVEDDGYAHVDSKNSKSCNYAGWKIHVSIDRGKNSENLEKVWDEIIMPCLVKHKISSFKVSQNCSNNEKVPGKEIVIYFTENELTTCKTMLLEMQKKLEEEKIKPNNDAPKHRIIKNGTSEYTNDNETPLCDKANKYYFYQVNDSLNSVKERREAEINSPFSNIDLKVENQDDIIDSVYKLY